jgi:hypothetical protein
LADSIDIPSADQPAILPNWRRENLFNGITLLAETESILSEQGSLLMLRIGNSLISPLPYCGAIVRAAASAVDIAVGRR